MVTHLRDIAHADVKILTPVLEKWHYNFEEQNGQSLDTFGNVPHFAIFTNRVLAYSITDLKQKELDHFFARGVKKSKAIPYGPTEWKISIPVRRYVMMPLDQSIITINDLKSYLKTIGADDYSFWSSGTKQEIGCGVWVKNGMLYIPVYIGQ